MRHKTIQSALAQRREQLGFVTLQDMANFLNDHRTADEPGVTTRYSVHDWVVTGRYAPGRDVRPLISRALCIPLEAVTLLCSGLSADIPDIPDPDQLLGGDHAE
jgi:hypothetical protein